MPDRDEKGMGPRIAAIVASLVLFAANPGWPSAAAALLVCAAFAWQARNHRAESEALTRASHTDALTGCLNRRGFEARAGQSIRAAAEEGRPVGVIALDLDGFKQVNDSGGHAAGDRVLREVGLRLARATGRGTLIGRLGGDEFALLLFGADEDAATAAAERIDAALAGVTRASIGVAAMPCHGTALDALLAWADSHLYETKLRRRLQRRRLIPSAACVAELSYPPS
jgi:diguanylate cyclase (GGDEF)-like protein